MVLQRKRTVKPKTLWHDVTNLRAMFNWAMIQGGKKVTKNLLVATNPVDDLDMAIIGNTKSERKRR